MKQSEILPKVEEKRKAEGLSQGDIAKKLGCSRESYNKWINGKAEPNQGKIIDMFSYLTDKNLVVVKNDRKEPEYMNTPAEWNMGEDVKLKTGLKDVGQDKD